MAKDSEGRSRLAVNVSVGKEIDASLADIITALLKPGAVEVGTLLGETLGMLSDRVRRKRALNIQDGLETVRKQLDASNVNKESLAPPDEEELFLMLDGLSLSSDEGVRELWARLIAQSLDPDAPSAARAPFIQIIQNLTPLDAKVISLLSFENKQKDSFYDQMSSVKYRRDFERPSLEINRIFVDTLKAVKSSINSEADRLGLPDSMPDGWAENLIRLGVIELEEISKRAALPSLPFGATAVGDPGKVIDRLWKEVQALSRSDDRQNRKPAELMLDSPTNSEKILSVRFSAFGRAFAQSCALL